MTLSEKVEQRFTGRPDSFVPARVLQVRDGAPFPPAAPGPRPHDCPTRWHLPRPRRIQPRVAAARRSRTRHSSTTGAPARGATRPSDPQGPPLPLNPPGRRRWSGSPGATPARTTPSRTRTPESARRSTETSTPFSASGPKARFEYQAAGKPIMPAPRHQEPPTRRTPSWLSTAQHSGPASSYRPAASTSVRAAADTGTKAPMSRATDSRRSPLTARAVAGFSNMPPSTAEPMRGSSAKKRGVFVLPFRPSDRRQQRTRSTESSYRRRG
jgi:hypothetical protein